MVHDSAALLVRQNSWQPNSTQCMICDCAFVRVVALSRPLFPGRTKRLPDGGVAPFAGVIITLLYHYCIIAEIH